MPETLEGLIGEKLVFGFPGTKLTSEVVRHFQQTQAGGVIFYRINFESPEQLRGLIHDLEEALGRRLLVSVDHEGGRVIMYRDGVTIFPDNMAIGQAATVDDVRRMAEITARELRALGTDVNFAPTLDVLTADFSPNIGIRSFGPDAKRVAELGVAYIKALQAGGVSATAKHFPGQGMSSLDAHLRLPTLQTTWEEIREFHEPPFVAAIDAGIDVIMSSHPLYPRLDPKPDNIATFSRRIIYDYLREELNFRGIIASDDLEMGAIREISPIDAAAVRTAAAGHDLILACHDLDAQKKLTLALWDAYKSRFLPLPELEESADRIRRLKDKRPSRFEGTIGPDPAGPPLARKLAAQGTVILQDREKRLPLPASLRSDVGVIFPKLSSLAAKIMIEKPYEDEVTHLHHLIGPRAGHHAVELYDLEATDEDVRRAGELAARSACTLFFCFDAHLWPSQRKLLEAVQRSSRALVVACLRDPWDKKFLRPQDSGLTAFGFRDCQIRATIDRVFGPA